MPPVLYRKTENSRFCRPDRQVPQTLWRRQILIDRLLSLNLKKGAHWRLFLCLAFLSAAPIYAETACSTGQPDELTRIRHVHDGDTIRLDDGRKVRLIGINAPELAHDDRPAQAFATQARDALKAAIAAHDNQVGLVYGAERFDRYKRTLAHLFTPDGDNLQARLLTQGVATAIAHPPNTAYSECYERQEMSARCQGVGIWSNPELAIIKAAELTPANSGYHLVSGRVERVSQTGKGVWIFMSKLMLGIKREYLLEFDQSALLSLAGKRLTVRGWIQPKSRKKAKKKSLHGETVKYYMNIRHPSAIEIYPRGENTKC